MNTTETVTKTCHNCAFWKSNDPDSGQCRRHAPQNVAFEVDDKTTIQSHFPMTKATDWCGDFERARGE